MINYKVIVIGGGHAGIEASLASARLGLKTLLISHKIETIGTLSCNPSFGGPAKGGLIREVDALGGYIGYGADLAAIQCRTLGESKGPAVRSTRVVVDRTLYKEKVQEFLKNHINIFLKEAEAAEIISENKKVIGVKLKNEEIILAQAVVVCGGTFLNAKIFHGLKESFGGRVGEENAMFLSGSLKKLGHNIGRLSTSTPPRLKKDTVNLNVLEQQKGDPLSRPFSTLNNKVQNLNSCWLTWTNPQTHTIVKKGLSTSACFVADDFGLGPRYCPSIEDKVYRFPQRERHQIFIEPDGEDIFFPSGLTTGLAPKVQQEMINSIKGLEEAQIVKYGYAIEYDYIHPTDLTADLESTFCQNLFLAGQINGTSGYEEAAAQGLLAGLNAGLKVKGAEKLILKRSEALTGVMADDLSILGLNEPYRMFSSRAEWRLLLREDNADLRLSPLAIKLGLLDEKRQEIFKNKIKDMELGEILLEQKITPQESLTCNKEELIIKENMKVKDILKRPNTKLEDFYKFIPKLKELNEKALLSLEIKIKFAGYIKRQEEEVERLSRNENKKFPPDINFDKVPSLSNEVRESLKKHKPKTLGQAGRISGITPAALTVLAIYLKSLEKKQF